MAVPKYQIYQKRQVKLYEFGEKAKSIFLFWRQRVENIEEIKKLGEII